MNTPQGNTLGKIVEGTLKAVKSAQDPTKRSAEIERRFGAAKGAPRDEGSGAVHQVIKHMHARTGTFPLLSRGERTICHEMIGAFGSEKVLDIIDDCVKHYKPTNEYPMVTMTYVRWWAGHKYNPNRKPKYVFVG